MGRRRRGREEAPPPAEYIEADLKPGDKVRCAGCDKEHTLVARKERDPDVIDWNWCFGVARMHLAKGCPVTPFCCQQQNTSDYSARCWLRALKRMERCTGCGRGPRDRNPDRPDEPVSRHNHFPAVPLGSLCGWCEDALEVGCAALASRGETAWRTLCTQYLFDIPAYDEEGAVPGTAFDALREAARLLARVTAGPNLLSAKDRWSSPLGWDDEVASVPACVAVDDLIRRPHSDDPLAEMDDATAALLTELGAAVGQAISLAQKASHHAGSSILGALIRANSNPDPYAVLYEEHEEDPC